MKRLAAALVMATFVVNAATTYYVDKTRPDDSGDGLTLATAKRTIQAAVDLAAIGDTVLVAPGVYDEGGGCPTGEPTYMNRVYLSKGITLKSTGGADVTHIVGAHDPDKECVEYWMGCGPKAVRCILATDTSHETVIEGFTIRGGATHPKSEKESIDAANGGAFRAAASSQLAAIVDCVVSNNVGIRGGATYRAHCVRTKFHDNLAIVKGAIGNWSYFHCCLASGNLCSLGALCVGGASVNCTYVNNRVAVLLTESGKFYNTVAMQNNCRSGNNDKNTEHYSSVVPDGYSVKSADANSVTNASPVQFFAPFLGDYRPLPSSDLVGRADATNLDKIPLPSSVVRDRDFTGRTIDRTQPFQVGAFQALSPEPASGRLWFSDANVEIDGRPGDGNANYIYTETYPTQILMRPLLTGTQRLYAWNVSGRYRAPMPDDSLLFLLPAPGLCYTNALRVAAKTVYVDASASVGGDGSAAAPFKTIQAAIDADSAAASSVTYHVIQVAAGRYDSDEGLKEARGCTNRVTVPAGYPVRILGAGEGETFIVGAPDPDSPSGDGRGPAAIRCVASDAANAGHCTILQNLTLTDGYCGYGEDNGTKDVPMHQGAGFAVLYSNFAFGQIADCTVTNCWTYRGAVYGSTVYRSRFVDCWGGNGGIRYSKLIACVIENMRNTGGNANPLSFNCMAYNTTIVHDDNSLFQVVAVPATNCVVVGSKQATTTSLWSGTYVWDILQGVPATAVPTLADPQFTRRAQGDYHALNTSPIRGGGVWFDELPREYSPDRDGNPMTFVGGRPSSGAYQTFRPGWSVDLGTPSYGVTATGDTGYGELAEGRTVAVALDVSAATRPVLGLSVNGTPLSNATATNFVVTAADLVDGRFQVAPLLGTNWYVNAVSGSDAATGWTPETAKRTFQGVFTGNSFLAGDVVHAAPGTYDEGTVPGDQYTMVKNRLAIPSGVCVVGDEGAEKTIIKGADATDPVVDAVGRGTNSTRCVFMNAKSQLRGFTLTGGRTCGDGSQTGSANWGGGVYGAAGVQTKSIGNSAVVVDCIISNNASCRGGGAHAVALVNCRLFENWAKNNRSAASNCHLLNCIVDRNRGVNSLQNCYMVYNCTFGPDAKKEDGTETPAYGLPLGPVVNCLFLGTTVGTSVQANNDAPLDATNCVFVARPAPSSYCRYENCVQTENPEVDGDCRPVLDSCPAVDFGDWSLVPEDLQTFAGERDALGGQRVYNGAVDAGAVEGDWRARYSKDIRNSGVSVAAVSPAVIETSEKKVRIPDGSLEAVLTGGGNAKVLLYVRQNGAGVLTAKVNGEELAPTSVVDGVASYAFLSPGVGSSLVLAYVPAAEGDYAEIDKIDFRGGLMVIFK